MVPSGPNGATSARGCVGHHVLASGCACNSCVQQTRSVASAHGQCYVVLLRINAYGNVPTHEEFGSRKAVLAMRIAITSLCLTLYGDQVRAYCPRTDLQRNRLHNRVRDAPLQGLRMTLVYRSWLYSNDPRSDSVSNRQQRDDGFCKKLTHEEAANTNWLADSKGLLPSGPL